MRGAIIHAPGDVRVEERPDPTIVDPTDAILRLSATCICGSDLWDYRGINPVTQPKPIGHEYCGIVEAVGDHVTTIKPGQFVIGSFSPSDNTCPNCLAGYQTSCQHKTSLGGCQAEAVRVPLADGTLVATPDLPSDDMIPSLLSLSDVMGTGWFAAVAAGVRPGKTVAVVGDGAVGLLGVLAAAQLGAERIIAMSRHQPRQTLAREFGATDIVAERGDDGVARIKELTGGIGADSVLECVGTNDAMMQAIRSTRPGGTSDMWASPTASSCRVRTCSTPMFICTVDPPRYAASCPSSSTWSGTTRSTPAKSSTSSSPSPRSPTAIAPWTNAPRSRRCSARDTRPLRLLSLTTGLVTALVTSASVACGAPTEVGRGPASSAAPTSSGGTTTMSSPTATQARAPQITEGAKPCVSD